MRLVSLPDAVRLLGIPLVRSDFDTEGEVGYATERQLTALSRFRVKAPTATPFEVARKTIATLVARARDEANNPCAIWQINKLVQEYKWRARAARALSFTEALAAIDEERAKAGKPYRPRR